MGDIYELGTSVIPDAPLISLFEVSNILSEAVLAFEYFEAITFYTGFLFGLGWVTRKGIQAIRSKPSPSIPDHLTESNLQLPSEPSTLTNEDQIESKIIELTPEYKTEEE